jgi:O-acetylhomoserine/O-acetylserine sulfhydrylase-like pyridoxal-dependent enzyme
MTTGIVAERIRKYLPRGNGGLMGSIGIEHIDNILADLKQTLDSTAL